MGLLQKSAVTKDIAMHDQPPKDGTAEFLIHAACEECGWRCAIPGEGMRWPECPVCRTLVMPKRASGVGQGFGDSHAYVGIYMPEEEAMRVRAIVFRLSMWTDRRAKRAAQKREQRERDYFDRRFTTAADGTTANAEVIWLADPIADSGDVIKNTRTGELLLVGGEGLNDRIVVTRGLGGTKRQEIQAGDPLYILGDIIGES